MSLVVVVVVVVVVVTAAKVGVAGEEVADSLVQLVLLVIFENNRPESVSRK